MSVQIKVIETYSYGESFESMLNDAYAEGWRMHSWRVVRGNYDTFFYAVLEKE